MRERTIKCVKVPWSNTSKCEATCELEDQMCKKNYPQLFESGNFQMMESLFSFHSYFGIIEFREEFLKCEENVMSKYFGKNSSGEPQTKLGQGSSNQHNVTPHVILQLKLSVAESLPSLIELLSLNAPPPP